MDILKKEIIPLSGNNIHGNISSEGNDQLQAIVTLFGPDAFFQKTKSDESGYFHFDSLKSAEYEIKIQKEGFQTAQVNLFLTVKDKQSKNLPIALKPLCSVNGYVYLSDSITPVLNAQVILQQGPVRKSTYSDAGGYFEFFNIPESDYTLFVFDAKSGKLFTKAIHRTKETLSKNINFYLQ